MLPSIEPSEVGVTGLIWLFLSYGYVLYIASNYISDGSDLLLLVPSMAGLVGSVVLPLLGAVPDGAIMLFSGLGKIEEAQETLSVGVGALAGSTIMLLTIPWFMSVFAGRVDLVGPYKFPNYTDKPKLSADIGLAQTLTRTGISITDEVRGGALVMIATTVPYFLIQIPASFLHGPSQEVGEHEKYWALAGLLVCLIGFVSYMTLQLRASSNQMDKTKRVAIMKKFLQEGAVSLTGVLQETVLKESHIFTPVSNNGSSTTSWTYQSMADAAASGEFRALDVPENVKSYLEQILRDPFKKYDEDNNGTLDRQEIKILLRDFNENISEEEFDAMFEAYDTDGDGTISFDEFISICYTFIVMHGKDEAKAKKRESMGDDYVDDSSDDEEEKKGKKGSHREVINSMFSHDDDEEEDVPEDIASLSPEQQQIIIKRRAFTLLTIGTVVVLIFSDPMVDVMNEIGNRLNLSPFYVAFVLAPIAANISEVIASLFYAKKKTQKTISISLTALEGAACMNNTFCLSIFMGLIYFRGLAWQYTAETISIVVVQFFIGLLVQRKTMTTLDSVLVLAVFPVSLLLVAALEAMGFD